MADRYFDRDRERRWRDRDYGRDRDYYGSDYYGRDIYDRNLSDRSSYNRNYYDRNYYGRDYSDRDYYSDRRYSPYGRDYGQDYDYETSDYGYDEWGTSYGDWGYGPYTGVGPQNYRRSDERIRDDVNDRLTWHGHINAREIEVSVDDGVVTLSGTVDSRRERRMAEEVAENVMGVWDVKNNIDVRQTGRWGRTDTERQTREERMGEGQMRQGQSREGQMGHGQFRQGMEVVGRDNGEVGQVKEVRGNDFLVDRPMARDVYVPFHAANIEGGRVRLNVRADEVDNQGWKTPEIV